MLMCSLCVQQRPNELVAAIEHMGIPTFLGGMARGLLGRNNKCVHAQHQHFPPLSSQPAPCLLCHLVCLREMDCINSLMNMLHYACGLRSHRLHIRQNRRAALREADVVIMAGTVCDFRLDYGRSLSRKSKIIAVNRDPLAVSKNTGRCTRCQRTLLQHIVPVWLTWHVGV